MALWLGIRPHFLSLMFLWLLCLCLRFATCYLRQNVNNRECGPFTPNARQHRTAGAPFKKGEVYSENPLARTLLWGDTAAVCEDRSYGYWWVFMTIYLLLGPSATLQSCRALSFSSFLMCQGHWILSCAFQCSSADRCTAGLEVARASDMKMHLVLARFCWSIHLIRNT